MSWPFQPLLPGGAQQQGTVETSTVDKWFRRLDEPTRPTSGQALQGPAFAFDPQPFTVAAYIAWHRPLSEPTRLIPGVWQPSFSFNPQPFTVDLQYGWHRPLSEPTRPIPGAWRPAFSFDPQPFTVAEYAWFRPLSEPTRRIPGVWQPSFSFDPVPIISVGWHRPLSEPTRPIPGVWQPAFSFDPQPFTVAEQLAWHRPLSEPTRLRPSAAILAAGVFFVFAPAAPVETITVDKWAPRLSEPTRSISQHASQYPYLFNYPAPIVAAEIATAGTTTAVPYVKTVLYQSLAYAPYTPVAEVIFPDKWWQPLSTPTRRINQHQAPSFAFNPQPFTVAEYAWFRPLSEPTRAIPGAWRPAFSFDPQPFTVEQYAWRPPLSEPTRSVTQSWRNAEYKTDPYPVLVGEIVTPDKWFVALSEPTRWRGLNTANQLPETAAPPFPLTVDLQYAWHQPLSQPTRRASDHATQAQNFETGNDVVAAPVVVTPPFAGMPGGDDGGHWLKHREELRKLVERCEKKDEDDECHEVLAEAVAAAEAVLAASATEASAAKLQRLQEAAEVAAVARNMAEAQQAVARMYRELVSLNAELMRIRAEEEEEEEAIVLLHLLH